MHTIQKEEIKISPGLKKEIIKIIDQRIKSSHITKEDFSELKGIVCELAQSQKDLVDAQKELTIEINGLAKGLKENRGEIGGLSRSVSYALENDAYRMIPVMLKNQYGIEMTKKLIRVEIGGKEINIFGRARKDGKEVLIVGEAKLRLDERRRKNNEPSIIDELQEHVDIVKKEYPDLDIIKLFITHYATKGFLKKAKENGVIVIQSFEW